MLVIILIGVIAAGLTLHFTGDSSSPIDSLVTNKPIKKRKLIKKNDDVIVGKGRLIQDPNKFLATHRKQARIFSRETPSREDPFSSLTNVQSLDQANSSDKKDSNDTNLPPPPDSANNGLVPPPPVMPGAGDLPPEPSMDSGISIGELPSPPENQALYKKLHLNSIVGDRAILAFNNNAHARQQYGKEYITLGKGDKFENMTMVVVDPDKVVVEENGITKELKLPELR